MLYCALVFLLVSVMVGTMNSAGASTVAVQTSWIMELVGIVLSAMYPASNLAGIARCFPRIRDSIDGQGFSYWRMRFCLRALFSEQLRNRLNRIRLLSRFVEAIPFHASKTEGQAGGVAR